jgi:HAD superfamily hydrolase (TIGR01490 family)
MGTIFSGNSYSGKEYIVFFDLDLTISGAISGNEMAREAFRKNHVSGFHFAKALYLSLLYKLNLKDPHRIIYEIVSWVKKMPEKTMEDLSSIIVIEKLIPAVYSDAKAEIEIHRKKNAHIVILSSAIKQICSKMAIDLNIDDIICSDLETENGFLTGRSNGPLCFGEEKKIRLLEYCNRINARTSDAWYYGDSISDLAVLSSVGNPRCVNPDRKLRKTAEKRGWKILIWH